MSLLATCTTVRELVMALQALPAGSKICVISVGGSTSQMADHVRLHDAAPLEGDGTPILVSGSLGREAAEVAQTLLGHPSLARVNLYAQGTQASVPAVVSGLRTIWDTSHPRSKATSAIVVEGSSAGPSPAEADEHDKLVELLRKLSVRTGSFTLSSGARSDLYVDARVTTLHAIGSRLVGSLVLRALRPEIVGVGGLTLGADPIASVAAALSTELLGRPIHAFLVRKEAKAHGTGQRIEGMGNLPTGSRVCVVEDTTTTGASLLSAVAAARDAGLEVVQALTVVDREEGAAEAVAAAGVPFSALTTRTELVGRPEIR